MSIFKTKATTAAGTDLPPAGSFPAVLVALVDLGSHDEEFTESGVTKTKKVRKLYFLWELPGETVSGTTGRNHVIGRAYNLATSKKAALRLMLEKWRGKAYQDEEPIQLDAVVGKPCMVTITHKAAGDRVFANLDGVAPVPKGLPVGTPQRKPFAWEIGGAEPMPDLTAYPFLFGTPLKDMIETSAEWRARTGQLGQPAPSQPQQQTPPAHNYGYPAAAPAGNAYSSAMAAANDEIPF